MRVWVYAHRIDPLEVTTWGEKGKSYVGGHHEASAIITEGEHAGTRIDRQYVRGDLPKLGAYDEWPISISVTKVVVAERVEEYPTITVDKA